MRPWIEKLAKISKKRGIYQYLRIIVDNLIWDIDYFSKDHIRDCYLHIRNIVDDEKYQTADFKLYNDEIDLLNETITHCANKSKDYFLNKIENLE